MPKAKLTALKQVTRMINGIAEVRPSMTADDLEAASNQLATLSAACKQQAAELKADKEQQYMAPFNLLQDTYWYCEWAGYQEVIHREVRHYVSLKLNEHRLREGELYCDVQSVAICCTNLLPTSKLFGKKTRGQFYNEQFGFHQRVDNSQSVQYHQDLIRSHRCQTTKQVFERLLAHSVEQAQTVTELMVELVNNGDTMVTAGGRKLVIPQ